LAEQIQYKMKNILAYLIVVVSSTITVKAQSVAGTASYEVRMKQAPQANIPEEDQKKLPPQVQLQLQASLAGAIQAYELQFNGPVALYHEAPRQESGDSQMSVRTSVEGSARNVYRDLAAKTQTDIPSLDGVTYRITEPLQPQQWKLVNESRTIAGHVCLKATRPGSPVRRITNGKEETLPAADIVAWYAPDIEAGHGPAHYYGLPGLILQVDEGFRTINCTGVLLEKGKAPAIPAPKGGTVIDNKEFLKLQAAHVQKLMDSNGPNTIKIEQH